MKKLVGLLILISVWLPAQEIEDSNSLYVKGNALFLPVLMFNAGVEYQLSSQYTLQADIFISPWKSFNGRHLQICMGHIEGRYYFKEAFNKWYVGANIGTGVFDYSKWDHPKNQYQRGMTFMLGGVVGYQVNWKKNWNVDFFLGGGFSQSFYHGFEKIPPNYVDRYDGATKWNKSGEIIPYRGGIMISYKIK